MIKIKFPVLICDNVSESLKSNVIILVKNYKFYKLMYQQVLKNLIIKGLLWDYKFDNYNS